MIMNPRDWSTDELMARFGDRPEYTRDRRLICPECESLEFQRGPGGGNSRNYRCANGHTWNVSCFGMDYLGG